jgi:hypothetical protein
MLVGSRQIRIYGLVVAYKVYCTKHFDQITTVRSFSFYHNIMDITRVAVPTQANNPLAMVDPLG